MLKFIEGLVGNIERGFCDFPQDYALGTGIDIVSEGLAEALISILTFEPPLLNHLILPFPLPKCAKQLVSKFIEGLFRNIERGFCDFPQDNALGVWDLVCIRWFGRTPNFYFDF